MDTRKVAAEYRLSHWAQFIRECKESGLSIKTFCENAKVHQNVYYYWQRKIREAACERVAQPEHLVPSGFTEVKLMELTAPPSAETSPGLRIEIFGAQITADSTYPVDKIAALLRALTQPC
jgi:hypothetical protein